MKSYFLVTVALFTLVGAGCKPGVEAQLQPAIKEEAGERSNTSSLFDVTRWSVATKVTGDFDGDNLGETVYLLKSIEPVGSTGFDEPELGVKLIIEGADGVKRFEYTPSENRQHVDDYWPLGFFRDDSGAFKNLYAEDISGDDVPELIFRTGISGVSDTTACNNIVTYRRSDKAFVVVNERDFCETFNTGVRITKLTSEINGAQILKAVPSNGQVAGNKVEQPFDITVYTWNGTNFSPYKKFRSVQSYEGGAHAVDGESYLIEKSFWK